jgi:hypothetical protein
MHPESAQANEKSDRRKNVFRPSTATGICDVIGREGNGLVNMLVFIGTPVGWRLRFAFAFPGAPVRPS